VQIGSCLRWLRFITTVLFTMTAATAHAQVRHLPYFEGSVLLEKDTAGSSEQTLAAGTAVALGVPLTLRHSLSIEAEMPGSHRGHDNAGLWRGRTTTFSLLAARRFHPTTRVEVETLLGVSALTTSETRLTREVGWDWVPDETSRWVAPTVGFSLPITVTRRLTVVPEFRAHIGLAALWAPYSLAHDVLRARVGARWQF
jgi:hypothetical protein